MEIHLAILDGVKDRYDTPYFDNLKKYAQRPIGTFHALPIARGKSIFKSNWIRDMGEFYGANLFLAESSATTGGLDSLLEPTGNIKVAQDKAARAFGGDRVFFVTNGTSTSNKIVHQALLRPGDIVLIDRDCHKSHHYGIVLAGAQPLYVDAFPMTKYSMYGALADPADQGGAAAAQGRGQARPGAHAGADQLHLRRPRRQRRAHHARVPGDQARPDLPVGRGLVRLRALLAVPAPAHRMGARGEAARRCSATRELRARSDFGSDRRQALLTRAAARPGQGAPARLRDRLGAQVDVGAAPGLDHRGRATRTSTPSRRSSTRRSSPTPRPRPTCRSSPRSTWRGGRWSWRATSWCSAPSQLAIEIRREINDHPLISKYFHAADAGRDDPGRVPQVGLRRLRHAGQDLADALRRRCARTSSSSTRRASRVLCGNGRLRRHAVQGPAGERVRHPDQQDLAQQRAGADQHQQHAQRHRAPDQGAGRHVARHRQAAGRGRRGGAGGVRRRASSRWSRTCPTCPTSATSTTPSATTRRARPRRATCAPRSTWRTTRTTCEYVKLNEQGDRRAPEERAGAGVGEVRHPVSARLPDHGAGAGDHAGDDRPSCASST